MASIRRESERRKNRTPAQALATAGAPRHESEDNDGTLQPTSLDGVPDNLRTWWQSADPAALERATIRSGRCDVLAHVARMLRSSNTVLDLGCGAGLLARETGRRDMVGVDMAPSMVRAAQQWMDVVLLDNILEHYPTESPDVVVLCNVLEPYSKDMRRLLFSHVLEFLKPMGRVIVVTAIGGLGNMGSETETGLDLVFPTVTEVALQPSDIEEELMLEGLERLSAELLETRTVNHAGVMPGEAPRTEKRNYAVIIGRKPVA